MSRLRGHRGADRLRRTRLANLLLAMLACLAGCAQPPRGVAPEGVAGVPRIRLALAERLPTAELRAEGAVIVRGESEPPWTAPSGSVLRFTAEPGQIRVSMPDGSVRSSSRSIGLEPSGRDARLVLGQVPYRGEIEVRLTNGALTIINTIDLEEYLKGVVPYEIGWNGPQTRAAVEAQSIAARTYACARLRQYGDVGFDLYADVRDQVYNGLQRQDPLANRAVDATRGQVLEQAGRLIQAYYCSTCGGHTSWIDHVWSKPPQPYLSGRRDARSWDAASFCSGSRHFRWAEAWSGAELEQTLQQTLPSVLQLPAGTQIGDLLDLATGEIDASGRVLRLLVQTTSGRYEVPGDSIRWVLKPIDRTILRSTMFRLEVTRDQGAIVRVVARGGGNGHGVGMCQAGALEMAREGYGCAAILDHYYHGATLRRLY